MKTYTIKLDNHQCRPIPVDLLEGDGTWRDSLRVAIRRVYGPRAWTPDLSGIRDGVGRVSIYQSDKRRDGSASSLIRSVRVEIELAPDAGAPIAEGLAS